MFNSNEIQTKDKQLLVTVLSVHNGIKHSNNFCLLTHFTNYRRIIHTYTYEHGLSSEVLLVSATRLDTMLQNRHNSDKPKHFPMYFKKWKDSEEMRTTCGQKKKLNSFDLWSLICIVKSKNRKTTVEIGDTFDSKSKSIFTCAMWKELKKFGLGQNRCAALQNLLISKNNWLQFSSEHKDCNE